VAGPVEVAVAPAAGTPLADNTGSGAPALGAGDPAGLAAAAFAAAGLVAAAGSVDEVLDPGGGTTALEEGGAPGAIEVDEEVCPALAGALALAGATSASVTGVP